VQPLKSKEWAAGQMKGSRSHWRQQPQSQILQQSSGTTVVAIKRSVANCPDGHTSRQAFGLHRRFVEEDLEFGTN